VRHACCPSELKKVDYFDTQMRGFMLEVRASGGKTYYQRYTDERGREYQFKIGPADLLTLKQARRKAQQIKAQATLGASPQLERRERRAIPTLKEFVAGRYLPFIKSYKRSWRTDETVLRVHVLKKLGHLALDEVTPTAIIGLTNAMHDKGYAPGTIARGIVVLRFIFNLARKWQVFKEHENPAAAIPVPPDVQRSRFLDKTEIARLVQILTEDENQVAAKAILVLLLTGARRNEITHARWENVDLQAGTLLVPLSKSGKSRYVFLNVSAIEVLNSIARDESNPYIFPSPITGRPCASLHFPWQRIRSRAELPEVRLHDLRHSFASTLVNEGVSLYRVQRLLGHVNAKATQRYAHLSSEVLAEAAETMGMIVKPFLGEKSGLASKPLRSKGS